ncbi:MAG: tRNA (adenosine(37)-N6)-threonylcarbamoyltransferase complex ATPase subunit type 1 TsaE [Proteobacteria bacterium]|nr:tRNA (adenosine(37)-N6)-threonylcarbamoyltransferase complex ATPase subunit type 1 TsaE [Pseudomonadota bacterium]
MREPGELILDLADDAATRRAGGALGRALAEVGGAGAFVTLAGDLGAGKTTLARGVLQALGVTGAVRSPTYTLVESYPVDTARLHHLDWYRLGGLDDLEGMGFRDLQGAGQWLLVEWPERIPAAAALADLAVRLDYAGSGRRLAASAATPRGAAILAYWMADPALG